jgi:hypothetical protein
MSAASAAVAANPHTPAFKFSRRIVAIGWHLFARHALFAANTVLNGMRNRTGCVGISPFRTNHGDQSLTVSSLTSSHCRQAISPHGLGPDIHGVRMEIRPCMSLVCRSLRRKLWHAKQEFVRLT